MLPCSCRHRWSPGRPALNGLVATYGVVAALACSNPTVEYPEAAGDGSEEGRPFEIKPRLSGELRGAVNALDDATDKAVVELVKAVEPTHVVVRRQHVRRVVARFYAAMRGLSAVSSGIAHHDGEEAFLLSYVGELAIYLDLARLLELTVGRSDFDALLAEDDSSVGYRSGMYVELKDAFNAQPWTKPLAVYHARHRRLKNTYVQLGIAKRQNWAIEYVDAHDGEMLQRGIQTGPTTFAKDAFERFARGVHWIWFPAQKQVAEALGDTRVVPEERRWISDEQIERASAEMRPGDVIVERRNWYLSNVGLPGFWPHAALFVGTVAEVERDLGSAFVSELKLVAPKAFAAWTTADGSGHPRRILEAVSEGVVFSSTEHSLGADFAAAVRPTIDDAERRAFLVAAFRSAGLPYDFDFDFRTDDSLVCSELVYKALLSAAPRYASALPLESLVGRPVLSPNELVRHFDQGLDAAKPAFSFVFFLEGVEKERRAHFRDLAAFRQSHQRPKWDVLQP